MINKIKYNYLCNSVKDIMFHYIMLYLYPYSKRLRVANTCIDGRHINNNEYCLHLYINLKLISVFFSTSSVFNV